MKINTLKTMIKNKRMTNPVVCRRWWVVTTPWSSRGAETFSCRLGLFEKITPSANWLAEPASIMRVQRNVTQHFANWAACIINTARHKSYIFGSSLSNYLMSPLHFTIVVYTLSPDNWWPSPGDARIQLLPPSRRIRRTQCEARQKNKKNALLSGVSS